MALAVEFPGCNHAFGPPAGQEDRCGTMHCLSDGVHNVSCWKLAPEEMEEVKRTGCVFVSLRSGSAMFPMFVGATAEVNRMIADGGHVVHAPEPPAPKPSLEQRLAAGPAPFVADARDSCTRIYLNDLQEQGLRLCVKLDGEELKYVVAYNTEDGFAEVQKRRDGLPYQEGGKVATEILHGKVTVSIVDRG